MSFPTKVVKSGYSCGGNMWLSLSIVMSFYTYTYWLFWSVVGKQLKNNNLQLEGSISTKIIIEPKLKNIVEKGGFSFSGLLSHQSKMYACKH
jgi:hypothetical protein